MKISPSLASANQLNLEKEVLRVKDQYDDLHIDIEDGNFIPNITFGMKTIRALRSIVSVPFSFHLMVTNPYDYLEDIFQLNPSIVFVHVESVPYLQEFIFRVKSKKVKCGIAFNPSTSVEPYLYLVKELDGVVIMTSEPDGRGQLFIDEMLEKGKVIRDHHPTIEIWADGGVSFEKFPSLEKAGFTNVVLGRQIFS